MLHDADSGARDTQFCDKTETATPIDQAKHLVILLAATTTLKE